MLLSIEDSSPAQVTSSLVFFSPKSWKSQDCSSSSLDQSSSGKLEVSLDAPLFLEELRERAASASQLQGAATKRGPAEHLLEVRWQPATEHMDARQRKMESGDFVFYTVKELCGCGASSDGGGIAGGAFDGSKGCLESKVAWAHRTLVVDCLDGAKLGEETSIANYLSQLATALSVVLCGTFELPKAIVVVASCSEEYAVCTAGHCLAQNDKYQ